MNFVPKPIRPVNRHILIIPHFKREPLEADRGFVLPDSYEQEEKYIGATVLDVAPDCSKHFKLLKPTFGEGSGEIIVNRSMVEEISYKNKTYYMVLENYVVATVVKGPA